MFSKKNQIYITAFYGGQLGIYCGDLRKIWDDFQEVGPSMISTTPHLYNELYSEYKGDLSNLKKKLKSQYLSENNNSKSTQTYKGALESGKNELLKQAASKLGGNIESVTTGGAATSEKVIEFLKDAFKCHVSHGYAGMPCCSLLASN